MAKGQQKPKEINDEQKLRDYLARDTSEHIVVRTRLRTSERVLARVTDGIYREPSSALRELISNAYDADANTVVIAMDAPRFEKIIVRDDGRGMSADVLTRMTQHIGGSAKRTNEAAPLGIASKANHDVSPGGRPLIGKIGIGIFSVSQLARRFKIITKERGSSHRLVADIRLRQYSETNPSGDDTDETLIGDVFITKSPTTDKKGHGTEIILEDIKPGVRDLLRSADLWQALNSVELHDGAGAAPDPYGPNLPQPPTYHSGWISELRPSSDTATTLDALPRFPWKDGDAADVRMGKLFEAVSAQLSMNERPDLATTLDYYLRLLWSLSLASPVPYLDEHPFDIKGGLDAPALFWLSNTRKGQAAAVPFKRGETIRSAIEASVDGKPRLLAGKTAPAGTFRVLVDGVELRRPIRLRFRSPSTRGLQHGLLFAGKYVPNLSSVPEALRGGDLAFEAYLYWGGRVVPKENNGVLVRIRDASGALFDDTFFKYKVSEQTRLRQITAEVFIQSGLDAALNIDRESFNFAHPHAQIVERWVHGALRQLVNRHKDLSAQLLDDQRKEKNRDQQSKTRQFAQSVWEQRRPDDPLPDVTVARDRVEAARLKSPGTLTLVTADMPSLSGKYDNEDLRNKAEALAHVLAAFGATDGLSFSERQALIDSIFQIFLGPAQ